MLTQTIELSALYFGTPVMLISSLNPDGTSNLSPVSSYWALEDSLLVGLGTSGRCYHNLLSQPEAVLNLPDASLWTNVEAIAATTGCETVPPDKELMGYRFEPNKFACAQLTPLTSEQVSPLRVLECPVQIEAKLISMHKIGGEDGACSAAEFRALRVHVHTQLLNKVGRISLKHWKPLYYVFRHYHTLGACLGKNFRA
ncbi:flavin reductase family protein [Crenobacter sp. SG2305]|uniref:flavin reductase family protein n=1 Tax=Crenobacter oryzisoli TaxID=3056844 RepID=UPI0025AABA6C|nr:flavin reductase family protein [Crenobacter sp. SG2305]MDN0081746.1 flavin reductase family protein [Crenobacter sp. SG2305]